MPSAKGRPPLPPLLKKIMSNGSPTRLLCARAATLGPPYAVGEGTPAEANGPLLR